MMTRRHHRILVFYIRQYFPRFRCVDSLHHDLLSEFYIKERLSSLVAAKHSAAFIFLSDRLALYLAQKAKSRVA